MQYDNWTRKYIIKKIKTKLFKDNPIIKLKNNSIIESFIAALKETNPDAMGLNFFTGWALSIFMSIQSFIR